jgi:hypothetical protein
MKTKLCLCILAAILTSPLGLVRAQNNFVISNGGPPAGQAFDPTTGMPIPPSAPEWKDSNWKDPDIILTNVAFDGLPIVEVANFLRDNFHNEFDVVLPKNWGSVQMAAGQMQPGALPDWDSTPVSLQLKHVSASEIFNAMNLVFENDRVPLRWDLKLNGNRRIALLRVLAEPIFPNAVAPQPTHRIYYVGNLIGDEKNGGMTLEQIIKTVTDVWQMGDVSGGKIQFHSDAQLLVVTGTPAQIDFVEQTLKALTQKDLQEKTERARRASPAGESRAAESGK